MGLRAKIFISFLMITIVPLSVLIVLYYRDARAGIETMVFGNLQTEAEKVADHIDSLLAGNVDTVKHLSHNEQMRDFLLRNGRQTSVTVENINHWLDRQLSIDPELYAAFYVMNPEGLCVASSSRDFIGQNYSFRPYFQEARQGKASLTDLFVGVTSGVPGIYASAPVLSETGPLAGVLVLKFHAAYIFQSIRTFEAHEDSAAFVVNKMGIVLAHSVPTYQHASLAPLSSQEKQYVESIQQFADIQLRSLDLPDLKDTLFGAPLNPPQRLFYRQNQQSMIAAAVRMTEEPWFVVVSKSFDVIHRFSRDLLFKTSLIAFLSIILVIPAAYVLSTIVFIRPLEALFQATKQIERGEYGQGGPAESRDELGSLALAFNKMSESLQHYRGHLEEMGEERSRKLRESETNYRFLLDSVPIGIGLVDYRGRILSSNHKLADMLGYSEEELKKMLIEAIYIDADDRQTAREALQQKGFIRDWETVLQRKNGTVYQALLNIDQIELNGGKVLLTTVRDITAQKRSEQELKKAKDLAEAASRVKSKFLANMSHELRTPLNGILGYAQILNRDSSLTELQRERVAFIERSGNHLLMLINDILDLAKIEAGKLDIIPTEFHLSEFLKDIVEMIQIKAQQKGLKFIYESPGNLHETLYADEIRLRQILLNLLGNAVKFTRKGSIHFRVMQRDSEKTDENADDVSTIRFEVEDSGVGIPEEELDMIFRSFEQVRQKELLADGAGLGLAISRRLGQMLGSEIFVESTPGKGSRFWFDVKFPETPNGKTGSQGGEKLVTRKDRLYFQEIIGFKGEKRTILLVDNKQDNRIVLRDMLSPLGFEVLEASEGDEALRLAKACRPHLILMALKLPEKDGFQTIHDIRQCSELQDIPVIAVSASVQDDVRQKSLEAGFHGFIEKPVHFELLLETLTVFLQVEWSYASFTPTDGPLAIFDLDENPSALDCPPAEELAALQELVNRGMVLEIRRYLDRLEKMDGKFGPFAEKVRRMNKEFRFEEIEALLHRAIQLEDRNEH